MHPHNQQWRVKCDHDLKGQKSRSGDIVNMTLNHNISQTVGCSKLPLLAGSPGLSGVRHRVTPIFKILLEPRSDGN